MKARIKATGEIVEVINYSKHNHCIEYGGCNSFGEYETKSLDEVELIVDNARSPIDWEQRKYEIAKELLVAQISDPEIAENNTGQILATWSVKYADALIEKLKGGEQ